MKVYLSSAQGFRPEHRVRLRRSAVRGRMARPMAHIAPIQALRCRSRIGALPTLGMLLAGSKVGGRFGGTGERLDVLGGCGTVQTLLRSQLMLNT